MIRRRDFLLGLLVATCTGPIAVVQAAAELFPISKSDILKIPYKFRRRVVRYASGYMPGTIVVDTRKKFLYLVQSDGKAIRYGIGVGRQGFSWSGTAIIKHKAKWPTWTPPADMVARDEFAAQWAGGMPGGPKNPLGARALYLFQGNVDTLYRIHGTFVPSSIGKAVSSGCIRLINADIADLYDRVKIGTRVVVLQKASRWIADADENPWKQKRRKPFWAWD